MYRTILLYLQSSFLGLADLSEVRGGLWPSSLTAMTLKMYSLSSISLSTVNFVTSASTFPHLLQKDFLTSFISIKYPVSLRPPSDLGGFHDNSAEFNVTLAMVRGPSGVLGLSVAERNNFNFYTSG